MELGEAVPSRVNHQCTVCDSSSFKIMYFPKIEVDDPKILYGAASGIPNAQSIVKCKDCGMIFENPRFDSNTVVSGYENSLDAGHDSQHQMRVRSFKNALNRNQVNLPKAGSVVLDIGTAGGAFLDAAKEFGYEPVGLEPSQYLVEKSLERGLDVRQGTVENNALTNKSYDLICLWDVIEHLPEPKQSLIKIHGLLKDDGYLLINYPDIGTYQAKLAGKKFWWLISVHLHHFSKKSIKDICRRTGFEIVSYRRYWQILEFGYLASMAAHYKIPFALQISNKLPNIIKQIPIPYYASQTTAIGRKIQ